MSAILIVDDDLSICRLLSTSVIKAGHQAEHVLTLEEGLSTAESGYFEAVLLDVRLPDGCGLDVLERFMTLPSSPEVIIMTGAGDPEGAELALQKGAWDYLEKPMSLSNVILTLTRALEYRTIRLEKTVPKLLKRPDIIGNSTQILHSLEQLAQAAIGSGSVLITGDTGTGKELFARAVHHNSSRANQDFIVVDCASLSSALTEDTLFGHVAGAYTDAKQKRIGLIELAHKGTLFLDEVGELDLEIQKKFLRVLENRRFFPLGGGAERFSDFRLVSATNKNFTEHIQQGLFREDLFFRIQTQSIHLPPLRERKGDVEELAHFFMGRICERMGIEVKVFHLEALEMLKQYAWPGNVRELKHVLNTAIASAWSQSAIYPKNLPTELRISVTRQRVEDRSMNDASLSEAIDPWPDDPRQAPSWKKYRQQAMHELEKRYFSHLISTVRGDVKEAVKRSGLSHTRVYDLLNKHQIDWKKH